MAHIENGNGATTTDQLQKKLDKTEQELDKKDQETKNLRKELYLLRREYDRTTTQVTVLETNHAKQMKELQKQVNQLTQQSSSTPVNTLTTHLRIDPNAYTSQLDSAQKSRDYTPFLHFLSSL